MRQAVHILLKDVRRLRLEICVIAGLTVLIGWYAIRSFAAPAWSSPFELLMVAVIAIVIARLVHGEPIPGTRQFWITRPYRWTSLLAAKLLFIAAFIHLPIAITQVVIIAVAGFPVSSAVPGLVWSHVLLLTAITLPALIVAAVTAGMVPFIFVMLFLAMMAAFREQVLYSLGTPVLYSVAWVRSAVQDLLAVIAGVVVLYVQYKRRRTGISRAVAVGAICVAAASLLYLPWTYAYAVQTGIAKQEINGSSLHVVFAQEKHPYFATFGSRVPIDLPFEVSGLPAGMHLMIDAAEAELHSGSAVWMPKASETLSVSRQTPPVGPIKVTVNLRVDEAFAKTYGKSPVAARVSFFVTVFGKLKSTAIPVRSTPQTVNDRIQCYGFTPRAPERPLSTDLICRAAFRWPNLYVQATTPNSPVAVPLAQVISYSPFPAEARINPVESRWAAISPADEVTISVSEPVAHFRRDVEVKSATLAELAGFDGTYFWR